MSSAPQNGTFHATPSPLPISSGNHGIADSPSLDTSVQPVLVLEPAFIETPDSNPAIVLGSVSALVQSILTNGQLVPGIVARHPTKPGYWLCLDGNRRLVAARVAGVKFKAVEHIGEITPGKLAKTRIIANRSGKRMTDEQLAADLDTIIAEDGCSLQIAAQGCGVSASEACKARKFIVRAAPEVKQALAEGKIVRDTARAIASVPQEKQNAFLDRVIREELKSDTAEVIAKELRGKGALKEKRWTAKIGKSVATIRGDLTEGAEALIVRLQEIVKRLKRGEGTDPLGGLVS